MVGVGSRIIILDCCMDYLAIFAGGIFFYLLCNLGCLLAHPCYIFWSDPGVSRVLVTPLTCVASVLHFCYPVLLGYGGPDHGMSTYSLWEGTVTLRIST